MNNSLLGRLSKKITSCFSPAQAEKPSQVIIETTNRCNLNCPFCLVGMQNDLLKKHGNVAHDLMSRPFGVMNSTVFARIREQINKFGVKKAYMHFQGEPFLNKNTPDFARQLKDDGLYVGVFTNGQVLTDAIIQAIARIKIDLIRFSVDGASEETYQQNRVGGKFAVVFQNMKKMAVACQGSNTRVEWQFLPLKNNEHEVNTAKRMAEEIGVNFFTKGFRETNSDLAPVERKFRCSFLQKPCLDVYKQLGFYWNGDVVPCCYDVDGKEVMGNIIDDDLETIWQGHKYKEFRNRVDSVLESSGNEPQICRNCLRWR